jgi:hypothetical protein
MPLAPLYPWQRLPLLRALLPLVGGILLGEQVAPGRQTLLILAGAMALPALALEAAPLTLRYRLRLAQGVLFQGLWLLAGCWLMVQERESLSLQSAQLEGYKGLLQVVLEEKPLPRAKSYKVTARIKAIWREGRRRAARGKLLLYLAKGVEGLTPGSHLLLGTRPELITARGSPGGFDWAAYCRRQGITH